MYDIAKLGNDVIICGYFINNLEKDAEKTNTTVNQISPEQAIKLCMIEKNGAALLAGCSNKIYKNKLLHGKLFREDLSVGEDMEWLSRVLVNVDKIAVTPKHLYHYFQRNDSVMHSGFNESKLSILEASQLTLKNIVEKFPHFSRELQIRSSKCSYTYLCHARKYGYADKDRIRQLLADIKRERGYLFNEFHIKDKILLTYLMSGIGSCMCLSGIMRFLNKQR